MYDADDRRSMHHGTTSETVPSEVATHNTLQCTTSETVPSEAATDNTLQCTTSVFLASYFSGLTTQEIFKKLFPVPGR